MHEAKHVAAGLDLWYQVTCSDEAAASGQTWSKLEAFLAKDDAIHEGVAYVEPALAVKLSQASSPRPPKGVRRQLANEADEEEEGARKLHVIVPDPTPAPSSVPTTESPTGVPTTKPTGVPTSVPTSPSAG